MFLGNLGGVGFPSSLLFQDLVHAEFSPSLSFSDCLFLPSCFQCGYQPLTSGSPQHTGCHVWQACYTKGVEKLHCRTARKATLEVFVLKQSSLEPTSETFSRVLSPLHPPGCCPVSSQPPPSFFCRLSWESQNPTSLLYKSNQLLFPPSWVLKRHKTHYNALQKHLHPLHIKACKHVEIYTLIFFLIGLNSWVRHPYLSLKYVIFKCRNSTNFVKNCF